MPYVSLWLRYSAFIVLYPLGVASELTMVWLALPAIKETRLWSYPMPNPYNIAFDYYIVCILACMVGSCMHEGSAACAWALGALLTAGQHVPFTCCCSGLPSRPTSFVRLHAQAEGQDAGQALQAEASVNGPEFYSDCNTCVPMWGPTALLQQERSTRMPQRCSQ